LTSNYQYIISCLNQFRNIDKTNRDKVECEDTGGWISRKFRFDSWIGWIENVIGNAGAHSRKRIRCQCPKTHLKSLEKIWRLVFKQRNDWRQECCHSTCQ